MNSRQIPHEILRSRLSSGKLNPVILAVVAGIGILGAIVTVSVLFLGYSKKVAEDRRSAREGMRQVLQEAAKISQGSSPRRNLKFPGTPMGHMNRLLYGALLEEARLQVWFEGQLQRIKWDWVMTPESLRTEESLDDCLRRCSEAKKVIDRLERDGLGLLAKLVRDMEPYAKANRDARNYYDGFKRGLMQPDGGYALAKRSYALIRENHAALEGTIRFLRAHIGKFDVADDGTTLFNADVPDKDVDAYNALVEKMNSSLEQLNRIEMIRETRLEGAIEQMRKG